MGPDLTTDLNLLEGDPPATIKYVGTQNQLNLVSVTVILQLFFTLYCFNLQVFILRLETVDFPDLTGYKQKKDFFILI